MYLHIGNETVLRQEGIIGIFDIETSSVSRVTRDYLTAAQNAGNVITVTDDLPKSFIVYDGKRRGRRDPKGRSARKVYISQISSTTLLKRIDFVDEL